MNPIRPFLTLAVITLPLRLAVAQAHEEMPMEMQPGADEMKISVRSPADGARITRDQVTLQVATAGFQARCDLAGKPNQPGTGHYHVLRDKSLVNMYCSDKATVSLAGIKAGRHTLTVVPAQNDHAEIAHNATSVAVDYAPSQPKALPQAAAPAGPPSIEIVSPKAGKVVSGTFDVTIRVSHFDLTCDEMGKPGVTGQGHWHLNLDTMEGPMMGMMTMAAMSCERTLKASTAGLQPGSTHRLIALLADNGHAPLMPVIADSVEVKVK